MSHDNPLQPFHILEQKIDLLAEKYKSAIEQLQSQKNELLKLENELKATKEKLVSLTKENEMLTLSKAIGNDTLYEDQKQKMKGTLDQLIVLIDKNISLLK